MAEQTMTLKQRKWMGLYLETGNATRSALMVYYPEFPMDKPLADFTEQEESNYNSAKQIGWENLTKLDYASFLEESGITDKLLQEKILDGLNASKEIGAMILIDADGETIKKENEGMIQVPDNAVRHKYLETALRLKQRLLTRFDVTSGGEPVAILGGITKDVSTDNSNEEVAQINKED